MLVALDCKESTSLVKYTTNREARHSAYPRFGTRRHARQESRLVGEVLDSQRLESAYSHVATERSSASTTSSSLPHHLGVDSRQTERRNVGHNDKRSREDDLVACLRTFDNFGAEDDVEARD